MGISGLLQTLKPIQVTKHLEEFSGKTIAVDAYVWLHKGLYSCATELANGKRTHKYVDYAMHRVRLLKHYNIFPYIVFDGGPLPAKKGTEQERKQKREENLARGKALTAQGKHSQARECYVKCADVTPQMAFQFIKALKAEHIPYVVAPYEADAQLAYLEKIGLVDAILTEDSDLLVFGCKNVLYKLDVVANTVISISRDRFGSVSASASDPNSISLYGWSDAQFRAMAILSGCDYLPSIPGIGLKTANALLRKWKTAEQVIRAITLEGKKSVPTGYLKFFQLAEMCFLHQRVYCPLQEKLVHLTEVGLTWNEEFDSFVGGDMSPVLARSIAVGSACPISHMPMTDIDPGFIPRTIKRPLSRVSVSPMKLKKAKGKEKESLPRGGILNFFGPNPIIPPRATASKTPVTTTKHSHAGKASGKRTLAEVMDNDLERKKKQRKSRSPSKDPHNNNNKRSKFFSANSESRSTMWRRHSEGQVGLVVAGPSKNIRGSANKENDNADGVGIMSDSELDGSELSLRPQVDVSDVMMGIELDEVEVTNAVQQEEGYISPSPSCSRDAQDLSSPVWHDSKRRRRRKRRLRSDEDSTTGPSAAMDLMSDEDEQDFNTDILSSPTSAKRPEAAAQMVEDYETPTKWSRHGSCSFSRVCDTTTVLVEPTPTPTKQPYDDVDEILSPTVHRGPDLRRMLAENDAIESELPSRSSDSTLHPSSSEGGPVDVDVFTVKDTTKEANDMDLSALDLEYEEEQRLLCDEAAAAAASSSSSSRRRRRMQAVMAGWRQKWALSAKNVSAATIISNQLSVFSEPEKKKTTTTTTTFFLPGSGISRGSNLRRSETTVIAPPPPAAAAVYHPGHKAAIIGKNHNHNVLKSPALGTVRKRPRLVFVDDTKMSSGNMSIKARRPNAKPGDPASVSTQDEVQILSRAQDKLSKYRYS